MKRTRAKVRLIANFKAKDLKGKSTFSESPNLVTLRYSEEVFQSRHLHSEGFFMNQSTYLPEMSIDNFSIGVFPSAA